MSNYNFAPTLDGLNNVDGNSINSNTVITDYLTVNLSSSVPTLPPSTNNNSIASTAFVTNAVSGSIITNYVTTNTNQTISGLKTFSVLPTSSSLVTLSNQLTTKSYVDSMSATGLLSSNNLWTGTNEFDNTVTNNMFVNNLDVVSFQNGAYFDNVCPYSTVPPSGAQDLTQKQYIDNNFVDKTTSQTIGGSKTFSGTSTFNGLVNVTGATAGNINLTVNTPASNNIFFNFGNPTVSARMRLHYINALNRVSMNVDTTGKEFSLGVNTNDYIIFKPSTSSTDIASNLNLTGSLFMQAGMAFSFIPIGTINTSVVATVPTGFLYCDGSAVSRSIYAGLFLAIGTTYGAGDGSTTYNLPNFKGCFLRGSGTQNISGVDYTSGSVGTPQQDQVLQTTVYATNEGFRDCAAGARECVARFRITGDPTDTGTGILPQFQRQGNENRPVNHAVYYYIKF